MKQTPLTVSGLLRVTLALLGSVTFARSAISFTDIRLWAGAIRSRDQRGRHGARFP